jgi:hypothetical protein
MSDGVAGAHGTQFLISNRRAAIVALGVKPRPPSAVARKRASPDRSAA